MPTFDLIKDEAGKLTGLTEKDARAYGRFLARIEALGHKDVLKLTWREPRSGPYHRRHFAMLNAVFESQEQYSDPGHFRKVMEVGAGHVDFVPGTDGQLVAMPKSIDYESLDQVEFSEVHSAVFGFIYSEPARKFLWPHLSNQQSWDLVQGVLREFEA